MKARIIYFVLIILAILVASCKEKIDVPKPKDGVPYGLQIPGDTQLTKQQVTIHMKSQEAIVKPPNHTNYKYRIVDNISITVMTDFGEWRNFFIYEDDMHKMSGIADGADTFDKSDNIVAKARIAGVVHGEGVEVDEYHYSGNRITFYCRSFFNFSGDKTSEKDIKGIREKDYYPIWPTSGF